MRHDLMRYLFPIVIAVLFSTVAQSTNANEPLVFISAFAPGDKGAIHAFQLNVDTAQLKRVHRTGDMEHPFFMAISPDDKFLYSIHASGKFGGEENEQVAAYEILGRTGKLK